MAAIVIGSTVFEFEIDESKTLLPFVICSIIFFSSAVFEIVVAVETTLDGVASLAISLLN